jgi:CRP-like cAMP-binding protein
MRGSGLSGGLIDHRGPDGLVPGSLLAYLDHSSQARLLDAGQPRSFGRNDVLLWCGDTTDHVLVIVEGWVRVSVSALDGKEIVFASRGPGDILGEIAALHRRPRMATVRATQDVRAINLRRTAFLAALGDPAIAMAVSMQMAGRLLDAESARVDTATLGVDQRVAVYLQSLADQHGVPDKGCVVIGMRLTQQDIADRIGVSLRTVSRSMALLRQRQIVTTARRTIVLTRPDVLRTFASRGPVNGPRAPHPRSAPDGAFRA